MANTFPFFYKNYRANHALQALPFHVHGVMLALLCIEAQSPERGFLLHPDGKETNMKRLHKIIGRRNYKLQTFERDMALLDACDTIKFDEAKRAYYSPFILKVNEISKQRSAAGKAGFAAANGLKPKAKRKVAEFAKPFGGAGVPSNEWFDREQFPAMIERMQSDKIWFDTVCMQHKLRDRGPDKLKEFAAHLVTSGCNRKELTEAKQHFNNWVRHAKTFITHQPIKTAAGDSGAGSGSKSGGLSKF
jgi:hypothetical protein